MSIEQFKKLAAKPKRKSRHLSKKHYAAIFAATPEAPKMTGHEQLVQRSLFGRHIVSDDFIRLPLPPSVDHYYVTKVPKGWKRAITYISSEGEAYAEAVKTKWICDHWPNTPEPLTGRIRFMARFSMRDRRTKNDLSNRLKALEDALTKCGAWLDDSQIDDEHLLRGPVCPPTGYVDIWIETIGE